MTSLLAIVRKALQGLGMPSAGETVVVALSGGPDSVALLDALVSLSPSHGFKVVAAHLDHRLRTDSAEDARFCAELAARLGVPLRVGSADVADRARRESCGIEQAAREERYAYLRGVVKAEGAAGLVVAHTRDDQAETLLLRLLRGAGSVGLGAMRPRSGDLLRPMLNASRTQVLDHLRERGLAWREDTSNADPTFLRNRVRHELLPYLEARFNPSVRETLACAAGLLADEADQIAAGGRELLGQVAARVGDEVTLSRHGLASAPRAIARAALREALAQVGGLRGVGAAHVEKILDLAASEAPSGRRLPLPGGREAVFSFGDIRLGPHRDPGATFAQPLPVPGRVDLPGGLRLVATAAAGPAVNEPESAVVAEPETGLVVRTRRPGDRVRARGRDMSLKRFLMERRVPADLRESLPLVTSGHRVVWIPGQPTEARRERSGRFVRLEVERA